MTKMRWLMNFIDWLLGKEDKKLRAMIDKINEEFLDDDSLWFCCKHGLSVNKKDYTESELAAIKVKALQEQEEIKNTNMEKLYSILNQ